MSAPKSRRNRIQGGWASSRTSTKPQPKTRCVLSTSANPEPNAKSNSDITNWIGRDVDLPQSVVKYIPPEEQELKSADVKSDLITKPGVYTLSTEPSGVSRVRLFHQFLSVEKADELFAFLHEHINWEQKSDYKEGVRYMQPRLVAWYGDTSYSYSGLTHPARPEWPPPLREIQKTLEANTGCLFNSVLCNLYRDGKDHVAWHSDDEELFGQNPTIASVSLGDTRNFEMRKKVTPNEKGVMEYEEYVRVPLEHGSLLLMEEACQRDWQHRIAKEYHDRGARINLTYRYITDSSDKR